MNSYQQRVIDEKHELDIKLAKLANFLTGEILPTLDLAEQDRLWHQAKAMSDYSVVLGERIAAF